MREKQRSAFIAIVGCPNVGKSSILNRFLGEKIAIVSPKPQTTRTKILGVLTKDETQLVFTDTPGYHKPKNKLGEKMVKAVSSGIHDVDACLLVTEPQGEIKEAELTLIKKIKKEGIPAVLAINKIDTLNNKELLLSRIAAFSELCDFAAVVPVSAKNGSGINELLMELKKLSAECEHFFPDDAITDQPEKVLAAEYIREKLLMYLQNEVPHGTAVAIELFRERDETDILDIEATIYCEKESHKGIVIGKNGEMLKRISIGARRDLEKFFNIQVNLKCWVKVKEDWRNREGLIKNFGLD
ncbi:MAG: GTPase Era [Oscillospiraceae bacterium]|nr:GTPase Era [Oscillospiraceae bacterium]